MTYEEVKKVRKNPTESDRDNEELGRMIDRAIEKQIPKKVTERKAGYKSFDYECPHCNSRLISKIDGEWIAGQNYRYCYTCGQALDWSE